jgi:hypothetical protein
LIHPTAFRGIQNKSRKQQFLSPLGMRISTPLTSVRERRHRQNSATIFAIKWAAAAAALPMTPNEPLDNACGGQDRALFQLVAIRNSLRAGRMKKKRQTQKKGEK